MHYLYITENFDWIHKNKYGYTLDLCRINDSHEQHSYLSNYLKIYQIEKTNKYILYNDTDKIISIICRDEKKIKYLENIYKCSLLLLYQLNDFLVNDNGSTEFIYKNGLIILEKIIINYFPIFGLNIIKIYNEDDIDELNYINIKRMKKNKNILDDNIFYSFFQDNIIPATHQLDVLNIIDDFYINNKIGKIIWSCGLGKTLLSIFIIQKLNFKINLIGVPRTFLLQQFQKEILLIFPNKNNILFVGGNEDNSTTNNNIIKLFLQKVSNDPIFIITTYKSCNLLLDYNFDFKIGDEAHRLIGIDNEDISSYTLFHKIKSNKTLFMTATEKYIINNDYMIYFSMDNENIFGKTIDNKTVHWAIENKKITDYNIILFQNSEEEINIIINSLNIDIENINLFSSAFMTLKSLNTYEDLSHILIYTNSIESADIIDKYINILLNKNIFNINKTDFYNKSLHTKQNHNFEKEIELFKKSKTGIISCVYIFGEGFDCISLNGVVIAEKMISTIRIVQYILRPTRLNKDKPNKKAYILIPNNYDNYKQIIYELRNVDEKIQQKIIYIESKKDEKISSINDINIFELVSDINVLNKIILRLKYSKKLFSDFTEEEDEYNYIISINKELNLLSLEDYTKSKIIHINFIDNPEEYFKNKGVWINWYHFLGVNTYIFIQNIEEWRDFCIENKCKCIEDYKKLCEIYKQLPKEPGYFYKLFTNILNELNLFDNRRNK